MTDTKVKADPLFLQLTTEMTDIKVKADPLFLQLTKEMTDTKVKADPLFLQLTTEMTDTKVKWITKIKTINMRMETKMVMAQSSFNQLKFHMELIQVLLIILQ